MALIPHSNTEALESGTFDAHLVVNRMIQTVSGLCNISVISGLTTNGNTPSSSNDGDIFWTGTAAASPWDTSQDNVFAQNIGGAWYYTPAEEGWVAYDKSTNKFYRFTSATAKVEMAQVAEQSKQITILNPTTSEDTVIHWFKKASTITRILFGVKGTSPSRTVTLRKNSDRSATGTEVVTGGTVVTNTTSGQEVTSFNSAGISNGNFLWLETTAGSGTVTELYVTVYYTEDG